ncbi:hypothetical protein EI613_02840 [Azospirillum sp. 412522]|nr:hypothetical protein [Azospirillum sp. 412522]
MAPAGAKEPSAPSGRHGLRNRVVEPRADRHRLEFNIVWDLQGRGPSAPVGQWETRTRIKQSNQEYFRMVEATAAGGA